MPASPHSPVDAESHFEVVVAGAGVAGCCAALALARAGVRVLLLEAGQPGHRRVCGEFLSPEARGSLERLGVLDEVLACGAKPMNAARIYTSERSGQSMVFQEPGLSISRGPLDGVLWTAAERAGTVVMEEARVTRVRQRVGTGGHAADGGGYEVTARTGGQEHRFVTRWVVAAVGRNSLPALIRELVPGHDVGPNGPATGGHRFLGLKTHLRGARVQPGEVAIFPFRGGYCGLAEIEGDLVNAALLIDYRAADGASPDQIWARVRRENEALRAATHHATPDFAWVATANLRFNQQQPVASGLLCVGDAAGYIPPLTGDGMAMAARAAELAAGVLAEAISGGLRPELVFTRYAGLWMTEFRRRLRIANWIQPFFTEPLLTKTGLALANCAPGLVRILVKSTRGSL